jgi:hypothetical protein
MATYQDMDPDKAGWTTLTSKGDIAAGKGGGLGIGVVSAGNDGDLLEYDSSQPTGFAKVTFATLLARRTAWVTADSNAIDLSAGINQVRQLANGVNALTGFANAVNGMSYKIKLLQPASGAAGTITLAATGTDIFRPGPLTLSPTNGKENDLLLTYDARNAGAHYFSAHVTGEV